jgi:ParB-like chromosome segregation protein Spo0J
MSGTIEDWPLDRLRPHPENSTIFGDPEESSQYAEILKSIRKSGIWEPVCVKSDGTILSGHLRVTCARELKLKTVPVRVFPAFESYLEEVRFVIRTNTDRRQLSPKEIAYAFTRLKEIPREQGGAKAKHGGDRKVKMSEGQGAACGTLNKTRSEAASQLGVGRHIAEACEKVFSTPGVPAELKAAVNKGNVAPTTAAKAVRAEEKRQGGKIESPTALVALATEKPKSKPKLEAVTHEQRVAQKAAEYQALFARLVKAYREVDAVLTAMPLKTVLGHSEHHEYGNLIRDVALRAWREVEQVHGTTNAGRQMALTLIQGGAE